MPANLIAVTSFSSLNQENTDGTTAAVVAINPARIISVKTKATAYLTTGVTDIVYALPVNNAEAQVTLIVTEARAAIITAANANAVAT